MLTPARDGVTSDHVTSDEQAMAWFDAEQAVLLALAEQAGADGFDVHAWQLPCTFATFLDRRGRWDERLSTQLSALRAAERLGASQAVAVAELGLGQASTRLGAHQEALAYFGRAAGRFGQAGDDRGQGLVHLGTASTLHCQARYSDALWHCEQALRLGGGGAWRAMALNNLGWCHAQLAVYQRALECCEQALALHKNSAIPRAPPALTTASASPCTTSADSVRRPPRFTRRSPCSSSSATGSVKPR